MATDIVGRKTILKTADGTKLAEVSCSSTETLEVGPPADAVAAEFSSPYP
jgi:hypothetical protein